MKKKIFFWANYYIEHPEVGTTTKIISEIETLRKLGFEVYYTAYLDQGVGIYDNDDIQVAYTEFFTKNLQVLRAIRKEYLVDIARKYIREKSFDFFLLRINYIGRSYFKMLKEMKCQKNAFVMMESLSYYPYIDFGNIKKASYLLINHSLKKHKEDLHTVVDLMLTEGVLNDFYGIPCIEFGMGVNVDKYRPVNYNGNKEELNLIMVGCSSVYHGTDRIVLSLKEYLNSDQNVRNIKLHLVGDILEKDKKLIKDVNLSEHIICYGKQHGASLDSIYDRCNIALGPLAQYRIKKKDTGLKTKEYFARGIPYIYSGEEVLIEKDYPYIMQVPDTEDMIDLNTVVSFYDKLKGQKDIPEIMRDKARNVFSWEKIFEKVFDKVEILQSNKT